MANDRAELKGKVSLNTTQFMRGLSALGQKSKIFTRGLALGVTNALGSLARLSAGLIAVSTGGFLYAIKSTSDFAMEIKRLAGQVGVSTTFLQEMGYAAKQIGVNQEIVADAIKDLTIKIKDASLGAQGYEEALNLIGLKSEELVKLSPEEQFLKFADAIKKADAATGRFVVDEINDAMFQLLPLLQKGSEGLLELAQKAQRMGIIMKPEQIERAIEFKKAMQDLKDSIQGLWLRFMSLEQISGIIKKLTSLLVEFGNSKAFENLVKSIQSFANNTVKLVRRVVLTWMNLNQNTRNQIKNMAASFGAFMIAFKTGFLGPVLRGLAQSVFSTKLAARAMGLALLSIGFFKVGKAIRRALGGERILLEFAALGKAIVMIYLNRFNILINAAIATGKAILKGMTSPFSAVKGGGNPLKVFMDELKSGFNKPLKEFQEDMQAIDKEFQDQKPPATFAEFMKNLKSEMGQEFSLDTIKKEVSEVFGKFVPDSVKKFMEEFEKTGKLELPPLADELKLDDAADGIDKVAGKLKKLQGVKFRGGVIGAFGTSEVIGKDVFDKVKAMGKKIKGNTEFGLLKEGVGFDLNKMNAGKIQQVIEQKKANNYLNQILAVLQSATTSPVQQTGLGFLTF